MDADAEELAYRRRRQDLLGSLETLLQVVDLLRRSRVSDAAWATTLFGPYIPEEGDQPQLQRRWVLRLLAYLHSVVLGNATPDTARMLLIRELHERLLPAVFAYTAYREAVVAEELFRARNAAVYVFDDPRWGQALWDAQLELAEPVAERRARLRTVMLDQLAWYSLTWTPTWEQLADGNFWLAGLRQEVFP